MSDAHITDHADRMVDLLLHQFKSKPNIEALLRAWSVTIQDVEDMLYDMFTKRSVDTAFGKQLDILGGIVGEVRNTRTDEPYRIAIKTKILRNVSSGTPDSILLAFDLLTGPTDQTFTYDDGAGVAEVDLDFSTPTGFSYTTAQAYADVLHDLLPAGVGYNLSWPTSPAASAFRFSLNDSLVETSATIGFGTTASPGVGGRLGGVLGTL